MATVPIDIKRETKHQTRVISIKMFKNWHSAIQNAVFPDFLCETERISIESLSISDTGRAAIKLAANFDFSIEVTEIDYDNNIFFNHF